MINQDLQFRLRKANYKGGFGLSELIEACPKKRGYVGDSPFGLICYEDGWEAGYLDSEGCWENDTYGAKEDQVGKGKTPEEAVANLWLKLHEND